MELDRLRNSSHLETASNEAIPTVKTADKPPASDAIASSEKRSRRIYRWRIIAGLFLPVTVHGLNMTMVAGALPFIASEFHQFSQLNWIVAAFNLTAAASVPFWGQMADIFGRYIVLQAASVMMLFGSALCAGTPTDNFPMLLAGRALQGTGSAGLNILADIILADKVSLKDNARNNTIFTFVQGVSFSIGPIVGGYLTSVSWRWCFLLNIPLGVLGLITLHFVSRTVLLGPQDIIHGDTTESISRSATFLIRLSTVDFGGQLLFLFGMGLLVLALTWAGSYYPWNDSKVLAPLIIGSVVMFVFTGWEYLYLPGKILAKSFRFRRAMIPFNLLWTRNAGLLAYINLITGMALYSVFYFMDLYFTIVRKFPSGQAGASLVYYVPGLGGGALLSMFACNSWPRKTWHPLAFGTIVEAAGITLIATAITWGHLPTIYGMLSLTGVGTGVRFMPCTLHGVGYYRRQIASIVSIMSLADAFGGTLASTIMLNIFNNKLRGAGINLVHGASSSTSSFEQLNKLPQAKQDYLRHHAKNAIVVAFYGITSFMWLGVIAMAFLGNVDIKKDAAATDTLGDGETDVENLTKGAYITNWVRPKIKQPNAVRAKHRDEAKV